MRRFALFAAVLAAVTAATPAAPAHAACAPALIVGGDLYSPVQAKQRLPLAGHLTGVLPACRDVFPEPEPPARDDPVRLRTVRGVPAALGVVMPSQRRTVYTAPGTFPQLRGHPLARFLRLLAPARRCGAREILRGRVSFSSRTFVVVGGRDVGLRRRTAIRSARQRAGQPQIVEGDAVRVTGRRCRQDGERRLVAGRIAVTHAG